MCGRVIIVPREELEQIVQDIIRRRTVEYLPDWPAVRHSGRPGDSVPLIMPGDDLTVQNLVWGYEASWTKSLIFNTKYETALKTEGFNMWRDSLQHRRCVVSTLGFFESHRSETFINPQSGNKNKQQYLFTMPNTPLTFIAGIYENNRFSLLTTKPNAWVQPVHDRMPVVLRQDELLVWLGEDYASLFNRESIELRVEKEQDGQDAVQRSQDALHHSQDAQLPLW